MIFSVTERQTYFRCRQLWRWASFNGDAWQPVFTKPALGIGRLWHQTQAEWSLRPLADPNELALDLANTELDRVREAYFTNIGAPISEIELGPIYDQMRIVLSMVRNYHTRWGTPLPAGFTMVAPEQTCVIPVPGTRHTAEDCSLYGHENCDGQHYLEGTLDGLIADDYQRVYVLERKTYGQRPKVEVLNMQDQFLAYLWILRSLGIGEVGGLAYDGAWKREVPPKGSTLEDLFIRVRLNRNKHELDRFAEHLTLEVTEMANNPPIYINRRWDGCWDCDFQSPCIAQERGEDFGFLLQSQFTRRPISEDSVRQLKYVDAN
jgi:hypothetical protein